MTCNYFSNAAPCVYQNVNASIITGCMFAPRMSEPSSCQSHLKIKSQIGRQLESRSDSQYSLRWQVLCSSTNHSASVMYLMGVYLWLAGMGPSGINGWTPCAAASRFSCSAKGAALRCQPIPLLFSKLFQISALVKETPESTVSPPRVRMQGEGWSLEEDPHWLTPLHPPELGEMNVCCLFFNVHRKLCRSYQSHTGLQVSSYLRSSA